MAAKIDPLIRTDVVNVQKWKWIYQRFEPLKLNLNIAFAKPALIAVQKISQSPYLRHPRIVVPLHFYHRIFVIILVLSSSRPLRFS
jgi:hypothetical protein